MYASAAEIRRGVAAMIRAPDELPISKAVEQVLVTPSGPYQGSLTPYMAEPADMLGSRRYSTVVFLGPGRTGKTVTLIDGWCARNIVFAPGDMMVVQSSQDQARYYSKTRIKRMIDASPRVRSELSPRRQDDNTFDKVFRSGMVLAFAWPSGAQLAGRDFKYVAITEFDAFDEDVDGEGSAYILARKRTETFMSAGMTLVESSVRREHVDAQWTPPAGLPHQAPPATGITSLYNQGTCCWFYWKCPDCGEYFPLNPDVHVMFRLAPLKELVEQLPLVDLAAWIEQHSFLHCPHCGVQVDEKNKRALNLSGRWVPNGFEIDREGQLHGSARVTDIASYQLSCVAAAYQSWRSILKTYAGAIIEYTRTRDEIGIRGTVNLDQGRAYLPIAVMSRRDVGDLVERAEELPRGVVPIGVRFLVAAVDVQANRFVVQVYGYGPTADGRGVERWVVDRYSLRHSARELGPGKFDFMSPATHLEDWDVLIEKVIARAYPYPDASGRSMPVHITGIDTGGEAGVTARAYEFWRSLRTRNLLQRRSRDAFNVVLVKGGSDKKAQRIRMTYPNAGARKDRKANARGELPLWLLNTDVLKDAVAADLARKTPGNGYYHFPSWLKPTFFAELTAETRGPGGWSNPSGARNEGLDLDCYIRAVAAIAGAETIDWLKPPDWAAAWQPMEPGSATLAVVTKQVSAAKSRLTSLASKLNG